MDGCLKQTITRASGHLCRLEATPGTNGLRFGPQGGLRCNAEDLLRLAREWSAPLDGPEELLPNPAVDTMRTVQWAYNGTNGNNYGGLFELWGLGLHIDGFPPLPAR